MSSDTVELVEQAQRGDDSAFEALYRSRVQAVFRYAKSIVRNPTVAEDVTAQTFLQAWKALARLRQPERFDSWLFRIAHNVAISEVKRSPQAANLDETPEPVETSQLNNREIPHSRHPLRILLVSNFLKFYLCVWFIPYVCGSIFYSTFRGHHWFGATIFSFKLLR